MDDDVFNDDDGIVDDETDGGGEPAEGHEVEGLADDPEKEDCNGYGYRNDEAGDDGGGPVAEEEEEDDAGEDEADEDGIADAGDGFADELGLIVEGYEADAGREFGLKFGDLDGNGVGDLNGVGGGLAGDVEQDGGLAVGGDAGVDGEGGGLDGGDVGDADGSTTGGGLDDEIGELAGVVGLGTDEAKDELVVGFVEAGGVDDVGGLDGVDEVGERDSGGLEAGEIGDDVVFGDLPTLDEDGADAVDAV